MDLYKKIDLIYQNEENDFLRENDRNGAKIAALCTSQHILDT